jgi:hypothetical protein
VRPAQLLARRDDVEPRAAAPSCERHGLQRHDDVAWMASTVRARRARDAVDDGQPERRGARQLAQSPAFVDRRRPRPPAAAMAAPARAARSAARSAQPVPR